LPENAMVRRRGAQQFSPDSRILLWAEEGTGGLLSYHDVGMFGFAGGMGTRQEGVVPALAFAPDGSLLATACADGTILLWEGRTLSPDGRVLVATGVEGGRNLMEKGTGLLEFRRLPSGRVWHSIRCPEEDYDSLTFSPDDKFLAAAGYDIDHFHGHVHGKGVRFWETASGKEVLYLEDLSPPFVFSPDASVVVCPRTDWRDRPGFIQCWDTATGRRLGRAGGHLDAVSALAFSPDGRLLATGSKDGTILLRDATSLARHRPPPIPSAPRALDALWADLAGSDAAIACEALWTLVRRPDESLPLLRKHLKPVLPPDSERIAHLIADLDSDKFAVRQKAAAELERLGELAEAAIRKALAGKRVLEVRRRLEPLLDKVERANYSPEQLREFRAVAVLERIGTPAARQLLDRLARGAEETRLTRDARDALARLARRVPFF
jgi:hypothetical protein